MMKHRDLSNGHHADDLNDLGFGSRVSELSRLRMLNRDGSFNVARSGLSFFQSLNVYHSLLEMPWLRFHAVVFLCFVAINILFAVAFFLCGPGALNGVSSVTLVDRFRDCFFFSVQTFTTVGYGHVSPNTIAANLLVLICAFVGLFSFALATGLLFARFSRPTAKILYSDQALIAPYRDVTALQFRIANQRRSQLLGVEARILMTWVDDPGGRRTRQYRQLQLERERVTFFPLHWTVVHPIDEQSPMYGMTDERLREVEGEFLVLLSAVDDSFATTVHSRTSYRHDEIVWGAKFVDIFKREARDVMHVDLKKLHQFERVDL
jgi:inward rectifier potassium channel